MLTSYLKYKKLRWIVFAVMTLVLVACQANRHISNSPDSNLLMDQADYNVQLGLGYLLVGNMQQAKLKLIKALHQSPRSADANGAMAYYLDTTGEVERAEAYYKKAIRYAQQKSPYLNNYGTFLCRHQRYQDAQGYFKMATEDEAYLNTASAYENAGLCMEAANKAQRAYHYFSLALRSDPNRPTSLLELAKISADQQDYQQANGYLLAYEKLIQPNTSSAQLGYKIATQLNDIKQIEHYSSLLHHYERS